MVDLNWPKRIALFVLWPLIAAFLLACVVFVVVVGWPIILTPWFKLANKDGATSGVPGTDGGQPG